MEVVSIEDQGKPRSDKRGMGGIGCFVETKEKHVKEKQCLSILFKLKKKEHEVKWSDQGGVLGPVRKITI